MSETTRATTHANDPTPSAVVIAVESDQQAGATPTGKGPELGSVLARSFGVELQYIHVEAPDAAFDRSPEEQIADAVAAQVPPDCLLVVESEHADRWRSRHSVAEHLIDAHVGPAVAIGHQASGALADGAIIVALDGSAAAEVSLPTTASLAAAIGRPIMLLRIVPEPLHQTAPDDANEVSQAAAYLDDVAAKVEASHGLTVTSSVVASNDPVTALVEAAVNGDASLVALASRGDRSTARSSMSRTASGLVAEATCPVLVVDTPAN